MGAKYYYAVVVFGEFFEEVNVCFVVVRDVEAAVF